MAHLKGGLVILIIISATIVELFPKISKKTLQLSSLGVFLLINVNDSHHREVAESMAEKVRRYFEAW